MGEGCPRGKERKVRMQTILAHGAWCMVHGARCTRTCPVHVHVRLATRRRHLGCFLHLSAFSPSAFSRMAASLVATPSFSAASAAAIPTTRKSGGVGGNGGQVARRAVSEERGHRVCRRKYIGAGLNCRGYIIYGIHTQACLPPFKSFPSASSASLVCAFICFRMALAHVREGVGARLQFRP